MRSHAIYRTVIYIALLVQLVPLALQAQSRTGGGGGGKGGGGPAQMMVSGSLMALVSSTTQGGEGPAGSSILTHSEFVYSKDWWSVGLYLQFDQQGTTEQDTSLGPKIEGVMAPFYFEFGYAALCQRAFTDRSIALQTGKGWYLGFGVRFDIGTAGGIFFQASYKYRNQGMTNQDDIALSEPINQNDGYPVFGLGYKF